MSAPFDYFLRMHGLNTLERANLFVRHHHYPVSSHSFQASLMAMWLADLWNEKNELKVNVELVLRKMLLHDAAEMIVSDIPYPVRHSPELESLLDKIENEAIEKQLFAELPENIRKKYVDCAINCKDSSPEGQIVAICDMLELLFHCYIEVKTGNLLQSELLQNAYKYLLALTTGHPEAKALGMELWAAVGHKVTDELSQRALLTEGNLYRELSRGFHPPRKPL